MAIRFFLITMLIEVCEDVLKKALKQSDKDYTLAVETLRHLTWSIRKNHHLVYFPALCQETIDLLDSILNGNEIAAIKHSFSKRQDLQRISVLVQFRIKVTFESVTKREYDTIIINPVDDNQFELFEECHLLTENLLDAEFYRYFALSYQKKNRINEGAYKTASYALQGGGATTRQVFLYECTLGQHLCLAILDSDKKWPNYHGYGQTAKDFESDYNKYVTDKGVPLACHYYIMNETNEVENLIPKDVLCVFSNSAQKSFIVNHPNALPWFDIKKGLEYSLLYDKADAFNEWKTVFPNELDWVLLASIKSSSIDVNDFETKIDANGFKPIVQPWGSSILDNVLHPDRKHQIKFDLKKVDITKLPQNQQNEWNEIGRLVFNWCCCFAKKIY